MKKSQIALIGTALLVGGALIAGAVYNKKKLKKEGKKAKKMLDKVPHFLADKLKTAVN